MMEAPLNVTDNLGSDEAPLAHRESSLMRSVNRRMRHGSEALAPFDSIPFFCECENSSCHSSIWISLADFDTVDIDATAWLLVPGHEPSVPWDRSEPSPTRETESAPSVGGPADLEASRLAGGPWGALFQRRLARNTQATDARARL
jgi:hypothetical protein